MNVNLYLQLKLWEGANAFFRLSKQASVDVATS